MKLIKILGSICLHAQYQSQAKESFYYSSECNLHEYFTKNFDKYKASTDPPKSFQQQQLVNYYNGGLDQADKRFINSVSKINE